MEAPVSTCNYLEVSGSTWTCNWVDVYTKKGDGNKQISLIAIDGSGFFQILNPDGTLSYTRAGTFGAKG